jgi:hypothetical protein
MLNKFVELSSNFTPSDGTDWANHEPRLGKVEPEKVKGMNFARLGALTP